MMFWRRNIKLSNVSIYYHQHLMRSTTIHYWIDIHVFSLMKQREWEWTTLRSIIKEVWNKLLNKWSSDWDEVDRHLLSGKFMPSIKTMIICFFYRKKDPLSERSNLCLLSYEYHPFIHKDCLLLSFQKTATFNDICFLTVIT